MAGDEARWASEFRRKDAEMVQQPELEQRPAVMTADTPDAVLSTCPGAPVQAGGHRGLLSPHFTAEASAGHQRPGGRHWARPQGQPRCPELLKVKLPSTRTEADGSWAWGACPVGAGSQPGTG